MKPNRRHNTLNAGRRHYNTIQTFLFIEKYATDRARAHIKYTSVQFL